METLTAVNPATGKTISEVTSTPIEAAASMMERSRQAFPAWRTLSVAERLVYFKKLRLKMLEELDHCVDVIAEDAGKPKVEAITAEIFTTAEAMRHLEKHAEPFLRGKKVKTPLALLGKKSYISYEPRGTVLVISPWNYPFSLAMIPVLSALVSGNCVILKPSEVTPLIGRLMETLFEKAGFPPGTVQIALGKGDLGAKLIEEHPDYILFTGSAKTGKIIQKAAAERLIPTTLELSGKDPMIIYQDANLERAAKAALWGSLTNSGQMCMSIERIYAERPVYMKFMNLLKQEAEKLVHDGSEDSDLGYMTFEPQMAIVKEHVRDALEKGAVMEWGSFPEEWPEQENYKLSPVILTNVNQQMKIMQEETFGPVICVLSFDGEEEAVRLANDSPYGLNASIFTRDLAKGKRTAARLDTGAVCINEIIVSFANPHLPFGGVKESGMGRYHGEAGIEIFTEPKAILIDSGWKKTEVNWFPYKGKYPLFNDMIQSYYGKRVNWFGFFGAFLKLLKKS